MLAFVHKRYSCHLFSKARSLASSSRLSKCSRSCPQREAHSCQQGPPCSQVHGCGCTCRKPNAEAHISRPPLRRYMDVACRLCTAELCFLKDTLSPMSTESLKRSARLALPNAKCRGGNVHASPAGLTRTTHCRTRLQTPAPCCALKLRLLRRKASPVRK